jgi:radical SAM protein with 4Fe4S-binding SPASM domain
VFIRGGILMDGIALPVFKSEMEVIIIGLVLSPQVIMRRDGGRAVLFSANALDTEDIFELLYPQHAVILALFDGQCDLKDVKEAVAYLFDLDFETASREVEALLDLHVSKEKTIRSLIVDTSTINSEKIRLYDPNDFIVPVEDIDMSSRRCSMPCLLGVLPTMRCFTNCIYCYADREGMKGQPEFGMEFYKKLLGEAKECGIETIRISGGDLFCREDAFDLIRCTLDEGMYLNIPTKYPLSKDQVDQLAKMGLSTMQVSIDALSPVIIDKMVARPGYGKKILKTLEYLGEAGIQVRTNTVLTAYNIQDSINLAYHLAQMPHTFGCKFTVYGRPLHRHRDDLFCSPEDLREFQGEFDKIQAEFPHKSLFFRKMTADVYNYNNNEKSAAFWDRPFCSANRYSVVVLPNGKVTICEELYFHEDFIIGDLTKQTLREVWNSPRALELAHPDQSKVPDGPCKDCPDFRRCHDERGRCFREAMRAHGRNKPHWPDPRCPRSPVGNRLT